MYSSGLFVWNTEERFSRLGRWIAVVIISEDNPPPYQVLVKYLISIGEKDSYMLATFVFVPPGGGEADYALEFEIPFVPNPGDYIQIKMGEDEGLCDFIVRRSWWHLHHPAIDKTIVNSGKEVKGTTRGLMIECEYSKSPNSSASHIRAISASQNPGHPLKEFESTAF